jgi:cell division septation protein DedD
MTRMADPERPRDEQDSDDERFEDEGRRSIFSALWFRAILVVIVLGVVAAVAVPYVLELANQPEPKTAALGKPETTSTPAPAPAPVVAPTPPVASAPSAPAPEKPPATDKPSAADKPSAGESSASTPMTSAPAPEKSMAAAPKKSESSKSVVASKEPAAREPDASRPRAQAAPSPTGTGSSDYFVQVGAFKNPDTAKQLAVRLREQKYNVEEISSGGVAPARAASTSAPPVSGAASDRYDVHVTGGTPAEINAKLTARGLRAEPSGAGVVVKPSMPLRDAVALSKDLAVDGLKVQVRRAAGGPAPAPANSVASATSDGTLYRVRVGPFDDKSAATSTLRELEQKGYTPFIARGGQ